ncbi:MAG: hypothetical protein AAF503_05850 [Pseudomonadota bacterium]
MKVIAVAVVVAVFATTAQAQYKTFQPSTGFQGSSNHNDFSTGNSYRVTPKFGGGARIQGYNYHTGRSWNQTIDQNGSMRGRDADGNHWNYNSGTGAYHNFGTGRSCFGKGAFRSCF